MQSIFITEAITQILGEVPTKITQLKNGCYAIGFSGKGTIVSGRKVKEIINSMKAKIERLVTNSKTVEFASVYTESAYTVKGYRVTSNTCQCAFYKLDKQLTGNLHICKHIIAYNRLRGVVSLNQWIQEKAT